MRNLWSLQLVFCLFLFPTSACAQSENPAQGTGGATESHSLVDDGISTDETGLKNETANIASPSTDGLVSVQIPPTAKFVAPTGNDDAPGSESRPWRSVLASLNRIEPGDTLVIRDGTYAESVRSDLCQNGRAPFAVIGKNGSENTWTTIMGYPGERPRLYNPSGWQTLYVCDSSYVMISHLEVFGDAQTGNDAPASGVFIKNSHHVVVRDVWSHDNGGCGICSDASNHVSILGNRVWSNSRWNPHQTSGVSIFKASNTGGGDDPNGYSNFIKDNLIWDNFVDDSIGEGRQWGVTDGNGIIIDANNESGANGRTLIANNIISDNGGPGIMITRSHAVDILGNTLFRNVKTRVFSVVNNGDIGCNGGYDVGVRNNIVIPREDNPTLFQNFNCSDTSFGDNVWVRSGAPKLGGGDIVLPNGTTALSDPRRNAPSGCWTAVGQAVGRGANAPK